MYKLGEKRTELAPYLGLLLEFEGIFQRFGYTKKETDGKGTPLLVSHIKLNGEYLLDHSWISITDEFKDIEVNSGDRIIFKSRVSQYVSEFPMFIRGYKLSGMHDIEVIDRSKKDVVSLNDVKTFKTSVYNVPLISHKKGRSKKIERRYNDHAKTMEELRIGGELRLRLRSIEGKSMYYDFSINDSNFKSGAVFNHYERNKIVINETAIIELGKEDYTKLSLFYFKVMLTKTDISLPYKSNVFI